MIEESDELTVQITRSSNVKVIEHVLPRVDAEKYQADIPPLIVSTSDKKSICNLGMFKKNIIVNL